ncbi:MAG: hypothetical protein ACRDTG_14220, partial [Pseudonocardiaceae bacterium]
MVVSPVVPDGETVDGPRQARRGSGCGCCLWHAPELVQFSHTPWDSVLIGGERLEQAGRDQHVVGGTMRVESRDDHLVGQVPRDRVADRVEGGLIGDVAVGDAVHLAGLPGDRAGT